MVRFRRKTLGPVSDFLSILLRTSCQNCHYLNVISVNTLIDFFILNLTRAEPSVCLTLAVCHALKLLVYQNLIITLERM